MPCLLLARVTWPQSHIRSEGCKWPESVWTVLARKLAHRHASTQECSLHVGTQASCKNAGMQARTLGLESGLPHAHSHAHVNAHARTRTRTHTHTHAHTHTHTQTHTNTHAHIRAHTLPNESLNMECGLVCWCFDRQTRGRYVTPTWSRQFSSQRPCAMSYIKLQVKKRMTSSMFAGQVADDLIGKQIWLVQAGQE